MASGKSPIVWVLAGVGCLGLLFVGAIVAAIVIPNFITAREKAHQFETLAAMREVGEALDAHHARHGRFPEAGSMAELAPPLQAAGAESPPRADGWGNELRYLCWPSAPQGCEHYTLASAGRDGRFEQEELSAYPGEETPRNDYDRDIVLLDGGFLQYPGRG